MSAKTQRAAFIKTLKALGFETVKGIENAFQNNEKGWYAEVRQITDLWVNVWLVGPGLKGIGFPGGWIYESPEEIEQEIIPKHKQLSTYTL